VIDHLGHRQLPFEVGEVDGGMVVDGIAVGYIVLPGGAASLRLPRRHARDPRPAPPPPIRRFNNVGHFLSYARPVRCEHRTNARSVINISPLRALRSLERLNLSWFNGSLALGVGVEIHVQSLFSDRRDRRGRPPTVKPAGPRCLSTVALV
jgi:hypothetical protein